MDATNNIIKCLVCDKTFVCNSSKNQHMRKFHQILGTSKGKKNNISCILCSREKQVQKVFGTYLELTNHFEEEHHIQIEEEVIKCSHVEEFNKWMLIQRKSVRYTIRRKNNRRIVYYDCNRSNNGYESKAVAKLPKAGGSIKIKGTCPSRIIANFEEDGTVTVKYIKSHIGHEEDLRCQRLTQIERQEIKNKLQTGVNKKRIVEDARQLEGNKITRLNLLTKQDINNIERNIKKKRDANDMIATAIKVTNEWNSDGKNYGFLFKQQGDEAHAYLRKDDFAVGFMNSVMEHKLKVHKDIICIDGTHNTNNRGWELTTLLVKDDRGVGFPVAFLVSNRLDEDIEPTYFMSDDDPKYYNSWVKVMKNRPRKLLCSWHVKKEIGISREDPKLRIQK
ncbi:hypothetical protein Zmor_004728 [Zophobas morio]|uniref:C2H2-type domain-containing protein n=1 Tax=Zophobas morio TaxID=2755281 RepID=A0AA38IRX1_9CUCU|nr:hypothetical protein Zmor_004728 [Zophobas morio]